MAKRKAWSKTVEAHGISIRLFERDGVVYRDVTLGRTVSSTGKARTAHDIKSLGHSDKKLAESQARELAASLAGMKLTGAAISTLTLVQLFAEYSKHKLPTLSPAVAREARARMSMYLDAWGAKMPAADVDQTRVNAYAQKRRTMQVVAPSLKPDADGKKRRGFRNPRPIRDGAIACEFRWLASCFNWARTFKIDGRRLMTENPLSGLDLPREKNPRRPVASDARYLATMAHVDEVDPMGRLRCLLALARHTGRRESAICGIRVPDVLLTDDRIRAALAAAGMDERMADHMPNGAIRWASENDKMGLLFISPINRAARAELDRYLSRSPRIGDVPLFPSPRNPDLTIRRETAAAWLLEAEQLAELPKLVGGVFHPYRRLWATERKHLPDADVASAGGWSDTQALRLSYQHADPATMLRVVEGGK